MRIGVKGEQGGVLKESSLGAKALATLGLSRRVLRRIGGINAR